jgi:hypothetical protein
MCEVVQTKWRNRPFNTPVTYFLICKLPVYSTLLRYRRARSGIRPLTYPQSFLVGIRMFVFVHNSKVSLVRCDIVWRSL